MSDYLSSNNSGKICRFTTKNTGTPTHSHTANSVLRKTAAWPFGKLTLWGVKRRLVKHLVAPQNIPPPLFSSARLTARKQNNNKGASQRCLPQKYYCSPPPAPGRESARWFVGLEHDVNSHTEGSRARRSDKNKHRAGRTDGQCFRLFL